MTNEPTTPASGGAQEPAVDAREAIHRIIVNAMGAAADLDVAALATDAIVFQMSALKRSPAESGDGFRDGLEKAVEVATQISEREAGFANDMPAGGDWQKHQDASNVALDIACLIRVETLAGTTTPPAESGGAQATAVGEAGSSRSDIEECTDCGWQCKPADLKGGMCPECGSQTMPLSEMYPDDVSAASSHGGGR